MELTNGISVLNKKSINKVVIPEVIQEKTEEQMKGKKLKITEV
jgi:hypothetical protein